jgi:signal transduction histidine kinase/CheY-like chemotaxis protein/HPt (histidine-containing phosphotransfer) domain-containing protein
MSRLPNDGIVLRSILITVLAFLVASVGSIAYTAHETGQRAIRTIDGRLNRLLETVQSTAKIACFLRDKDLAKELAGGLLVNPEVLRVTILGDDAVLADTSRSDEGATLSETETNVLVRKISAPFDSNKIVGEVRLVPNPKVIEAVKDEDILLAAKQLVWQLLFVSLAILTTLILLIVRPISRMSLALHRMDPVKGERLFIPSGHANTEIGQLVSSVNELSDRLVTAIDDAGKARLAAEAASSAKGSFLANMSHEIRTPLNAVLGLARIGMRENHGRKAADTIQRIFTSGQHLLTVINDILDFSKIEAGKMAIQEEPVRLPRIVTDVINLVSQRAAEKGLILTHHSSPDLPEWVLGDSTRIDQILVNLLANAVKFTARGQVDLSVRRHGDDILFSVRDEGIGMTPEQVSRLFQPFEQADNSTTRLFGGTGLGLAISMNLARLMGGGIDVVSMAGKGSTFSLHLPLRETTAPEGGDPAVANDIDIAQKLKGYRILAAEDVDVNRFVLEDMLHEAGAKFVFAENGRIALDRVESDPDGFDVVLMDVQMPVMGGHEATRRIRVIAPQLPVIGLTAHALNDEREKSLAAGMVDHVTKPIDPVVLVTAILRWARPPSRHEIPLPVDTDAVSPAPTFSASLATSSVIDWTALNARYKNKRAFIEKLLITLLDGHSDSPAQLREMAAANDFSGITFLSHSLKGMAGNLSAKHIQDLAASVGAAAKENNQQALVLALELADTFAELLDDIQRYLDARPPAP